MYYMILNIYCKLNNYMMEYIFYFFLHVEKNVTYKQVPQVNLSNQIVSKNFKCFDVRKWCVTSNVDSKSTTSSTVFKKMQKYCNSTITSKSKIKVFWNFFFAPYCSFISGLLRSKKFQKILRQNCTLLSFCLILSGEEEEEKLKKGEDRRVNWWWMAAQGKSFWGFEFHSTKDFVLCNIA